MSEIKETKDVRKDLNKIVEEIRFVRERKQRGGYRNLLRLVLKNKKSTDMYIDAETFELMSMFKDLGLEPIKNRELVEEFSEDKEKTYIGVRITFADDSSKVYFPNYTFCRIIDLTYTHFDKLFRQQETKK